MKSQLAELETENARLRAKVVKLEKRVRAESISVKAIADAYESASEDVKALDAKVKELEATIERIRTWAEPAPMGVYSTPDIEEVAMLRAYAQARNDVRATLQKPKV